jgi:hypothetical protein
MGPRAGMDDVKKRKFLTLPGLELRHIGRRDGSQSLYRLSYPDSMQIGCGTVSEVLRMLRLGPQFARRGQETIGPLRRHLPAWRRWFLLHSGKQNNKNTGFGTRI